MSKRQLSLIILGLLFLSYGGYIIWQKINRGSVTIIAPAPFTFMFDSSDIMTCTSGKCTLTLSPGSHNILITKDGYANYLAEIAILKGKNIEFSPSLQKILSREMKPKTRFTIPKPTLPYILKTDDTGRQALVKTTPGTVIAYFARPLIEPRMVSDTSGRFVWIVDRENSIYAINVQEKSRRIVYGSNEKIQGLIPSPSGTFAAIIFNNEVIVIQADGTVTGKMNLSGQSESSITWYTDATLFILQHTAEQDIVLRAQFEETGGTVQVKKMEQVEKWNRQSDTIQFLYYDKTLNELHIQGEKNAYVIRL